MNNVLIISCVKRCDYKKQSLRLQKIIRAFVAKKRITIKI